MKVKWNGRQRQRKEWKWWTYQKRYFLAGHHPLHCENVLDPALCKPFSNKYIEIHVCNIKSEYLFIKTDASEVLQTWNILDDCIGTTCKSSLSHIKYMYQTLQIPKNIPFLAGISHITEPWLNPSLWWNCCKGRKTLRVTGKRSLFINYYSRTVESSSNAVQSI